MEKPKNNGYKNIVGLSSEKLDLTDKNVLNKFLRTEKPKVIINAAAKVGGILANNNYPYDFLIKNLQIQNNLLESANIFDIENFIFLGSSCIYPKFAKQPIKEEYLLTGELEKTNQWYAIAKITGLMLVDSLRAQYNRNYMSLMPTNLYGPNDNFDLQTSHVMPALIRKFHEAKLNRNENVILWGSGEPLREFLHVDDLAEAIRFCLENKISESTFNVGFGEDISIKNLAIMIKNEIGYNGDIIWDKEKPDGTPKKLIDSSKLNNLGWFPKIKLKDGIRETYKWYLENK